MFVSERIHTVQKMADIRSDVSLNSGSSSETEEVHSILKIILKYHENIVKGHPQIFRYVDPFHHTVPWLWKLPRVDL